MSQQQSPAGAYAIRQRTQTFLALGAGGHFDRQVFAVVYVEGGADQPTGVERVAGSDQPFHVAAARRAAAAQLRNLVAYQARHGVRWEVQQRQQRAAEKAQRQAAVEARRQVREAAPAMLEVLERFARLFPDPIVRDGQRLRLDQVAELNGLALDVAKVLALATSPPAKGG